MPLGRVGAADLVVRMLRPGAECPPATTRLLHDPCDSIYNGISSASTSSAKVGGSWRVPIQQLPSLGGWGLSWARWAATSMWSKGQSGRGQGWEGAGRGQGSDERSKAQSGSQGANSSRRSIENKMAQGNTQRRLGVQWDGSREGLATLNGAQLCGLLGEMAAGWGLAGRWREVLAHIGRGGAASLAGCGVEHLSLAANAVGKLGKGSRAEGGMLVGLRVVDQAAVALAERGGQLSHKDCALLVHGFSCVGFFDARMYEHLNRVAAQRSWAGVVLQDVSMIAYAYAVAGHGAAEGLFDELLLAALRVSSVHSKPQATANLVWALAKMDHRLNRPQLLQRAQGVLGATGKEVDASYLLWLLLEEGIMHQLGSCDPKALANLLWACGKLKELHDETLRVDAAQFDRLLGALVEVAHSCNSQNISNALLAVVSLGHPIQQPHVEALIGALLEMLRCGPGAVSAQALANTVWSCAKAGLQVQQQQVQQLAQALAGLVRHTSDRVALQVVSNMLLGCATLGCAVNAQDAEAFSAFLYQNLHRCSSQVVANAVWALSKLDALTESKQRLQPSTMQLLDALPAFVKLNAPHMLEQDISQIAVAAATLQYLVPELMPNLVEAMLMPSAEGGALGKLQQCTVQGLSNLLWSLAVLTPTSSRRVFQFMSAIVAIRVGIFEAQAVANAAWAYSVVMGPKVDRGMAMALLLRAVVVHADLTAEGKSQLYSLVRMLQPTIGEMAAACEQQPGLPLLLQECRHIAILNAQDVMKSGRQVEVSRALKRMGLQPMMEYSAEGGLFSIDIALNPGAGPGRRVAVEVDGPSHFTRSNPRQELGHTVHRRNMLELRGWRVVNVSVYDWDAAPDKEAFLRGRLGS